MACLVTVGLIVLVYLGWRLLDWMLRLPSISNLSERYILITGCDTGFGNLIAKKLDKAGCNVFAACLTEKGEADVKIGASGKLKTVRMDVTNSASITAAYEFVKSSLPQGKGLWAVLNNSGIAGQVGPTDWFSVKDYRSCMDVNTFGLIDVTLTFLPLIKKARGRIVNTASILGRYALPGAGPYVLSKYSVEAFSDVLRREMAVFGITVHIIEPGFFKTNIVNPERWKANMEALWQRCPDNIKEDYGEDFLQKAIEVQMDQFIGKIISTDLSPVVNAYFHALTGLYPRTRYVVGKDAKYFWLPLQALPEWLGDKIVDWASSDRPIPAACAVKC